MVAIETVFFDFGNTLAALTAPVRDIWAKLLREQGRSVDPGALGAAIEDASARFVPSLYDYKGRMREFWALHDAFILDRLSLPDRDGTLSAAIERGFDDPGWFRVFPETRGVLESLRAKGLGLGIISNNTDDLLETLDRLGLARYFDHVTYSQEVRAEKPDPAVFRLALDRAECNPSEAIHVGDVYEADVVGARSVGMFPVLVDRDDRRPNTDCLRIRDLRELVPLLEGRNF